MARVSVATALARWLLPAALVALGAPAPEPVAPFGRGQLAAESQERDERFEEHFDSEELPPSSAQRKLMPGQKPGSTVTAPPSGYDAKHLNRSWSRFRGAKPSTKAEKRHK
jgi:hypothetical protein